VRHSFPGLPQRADHVRRFGKTCLPDKQRCDTVVLHPVMVSGPRRNRGEGNTIARVVRCPRRITEPAPTRRFREHGAGAGGNITAGFRVGGLLHRLPMTSSTMNIAAKRIADATVARRSTLPFVSPNPNLDPRLFHIQSPAATAAIPKTMSVHCGDP